MDSANGSDFTKNNASPMDDVLEPSAVASDQQKAASSDEKWGFDLYPERKGDRYKPTWKQILMGDGQEKLDRQKCEKRVWEVAQRSPLVKIMLDALQASGCPFDFSRHVVCEVCDKSVTGGYDIENNQIVVCQNMCKIDGLVAGVLTHEMIHMFDHCRHKLDFTNIEHLACTEIRAANLTHCSFFTAMSHGDASMFEIRQTHQDCVKTKASYSVEAVHPVGIAEARRVVNKVFPQCYADLEPIGRRVRRNSADPMLAYKEKHHYGY